MQGIADRPARQTDGHALRYALMLLVLTMPSSPVPSSAMTIDGGAGRPLVGGLNTILPAGPLAISIEYIGATTCHFVPHGRTEPRVQPGWEWLHVEWTLRNTGDRMFSLPHPNHPGFRLVGRDHLFPGFYASYPGYGSQIPASGSEPVAWTFSVRRGTKQVILSYVPPGPKVIRWSLAVPRPFNPKKCG